METRPGEEVMLEEKFPNSKKLSQLQVCGQFCNLRRQHYQGEEKKKNPQNKCLTTTPSEEIAQTLMSTTSEWGLKREAWAASLV